MLHGQRLWGLAVEQKGRGNPVGGAREREGGSGGGRRGGGVSRGGPSPRWRAGRGRARQSGLTGREGGVGTCEVGGEPVGKAGGDWAGISLANSVKRCDHWVTPVVAQALSVTRVR